jgi:lysophospholipase L1-like esterase
MTADVHRLSRHDGWVQSPWIVAARVAAVLAILGATVAVTLPADPQPAPWRPSPEVKARIATAEDQAVTRPVVALIVGDSYTAARGSWARQACDVLGWICNVDAQGGTGYVANGHENSERFAPYIGRLPYARETFKADVVIVTGGRNDLQRPGHDAAIHHYFASLRNSFPRARLVAMSPFWQTTDAPPEVEQIRRAVKAAGADVGATWIDTDGWLNDGLLGPDYVHPNEAGHARIATLAARRLCALGLSAT